MSESLYKFVKATPCCYGYNPMTTYSMSTVGKLVGLRRQFSICRWIHILSFFSFFHSFFLLSFLFFLVSCHHLAFVSQATLSESFRKTPTTAEGQCCEADGPVSIDAHYYQQVYVQYPRWTPEGAAAPRCLVTREPLSLSANVITINRSAYSM